MLGAPSRTLSESSVSSLIELFSALLCANKSINMCSFNCKSVLTSSAPLRSTKNKPFITSLYRSQSALFGVYLQINAQVHIFRWTLKGTLNCTDKCTPKSTIKCNIKSILSSTFLYIFKCSLRWFLRCTFKCNLKCILKCKLK